MHNQNKMNDKSIEGKLTILDQQIIKKLNKKETTRNNPAKKKKWTNTSKSDCETANTCIVEKECKKRNTHSQIAKVKQPKSVETTVEWGTQHN